MITELPENIRQEAREYASCLRDYLTGGSTSERFAGIRVPWGIYSHRGGHVYMMRVRIPGGLLSVRDATFLADIADRYGNGVLHITTRQDIQLHHLAIRATSEIISSLVSAGLSPRGGGGNTVRNITACPRSGICVDEPFPVIQDALALTEYLMEQPSSFSLPRKRKIGFSGCRNDCAGLRMQDIGFSARVQEEAHGYAVFAGGGMGAFTTIGEELESFVKRVDVALVTTAILNIFHQKGDRVNRHRNRLRFLIRDFGFSEFKKLYVKEKDRLVKHCPPRMRDITLPDLPERADTPLPVSHLNGYGDFIRYSVRRQRQQGYSSVELRIPYGNISSGQARFLAALHDVHQEISFRTTQGQNIILYNIPTGDLVELYKKLKSAFPYMLYPSTLLDISCCKGASTCNLGICDTPALCRAIEKILGAEKADTPFFGECSIRINGCPNACARHPLGTIALHGALQSYSGKKVPSYKLFLGGRQGDDSARTALRTDIILPARNVPAFLVAYCGALADAYHEEDDLTHFMETVGAETAAALAQKFSSIPDYNDNPFLYKDWEHNEDFSTGGIGKGECTLGTREMALADLKQASLILDEQKGIYSASALRHALFLTARAYVSFIGYGTADDNKVMEDFLLLLRTEKDTLFTEDAIRTAFLYLSNDSCNDASVHTTTDVVYGIHKYITRKCGA